MVIESLLQMKRQSLNVIHMYSSTEHGAPADGTPQIDHRDKQKALDGFLKKKMCKWRNKAVVNKTKRGSESDPQDMKKTECALFQRLEKIGYLGEGSFGMVMLMKQIDGSKMYALKGISKEHIRRENLGAMITNERSVMMLLDSDWVVRLWSTYQDPAYVYFMMEPALGGELFDVYNENDLFGKMGHARFYIGCVIQGLQYMHFKRVIYRDLKLENCLLDEMGYCKLTDFGIAKVVVGKTYTVCGTADYFAPETLKQVGHNRAADWWACGVLLFIMAAGRSPFDAPEVTQIYKNIIKGFSKVKFPSNFASDLTDVIKSLCRKKPEERVTMQKGGVDYLKEMPWFSVPDFNWEELENFVLTAPLKPKIPTLDDFGKKKLSSEVNICMDKVMDWDGGLGHRSDQDSETPMQSEAYGEAYDDDG